MRAEIVDDFRAVVITAPQQYLPKLKAGDVIEEVKIISLRGQYFVCEAPPQFAVIYGEPEDFGNNEEDARNQPEQRPPFHQQYPSIGVLTDEMRTQSNRLCKYYPRASCSLGYFCNFKHLDSEAPPGWSFAELRNDGDVRGIPVTNRQACYHWRDVACRFGNSCRNRISGLRGLMIMHHSR